MSGYIATRHMPEAGEGYKLTSHWPSVARLNSTKGAHNPHDPAKVRRKYGPRGRGQASVVPCMLVYRGTTVGYLPQCNVGGSGAEELGIESTSGIYNADLFTAITEL